MKTLIIIVSIILLSYQIDRFFTRDLAIVAVATETNATDHTQKNIAAQSADFSETATVSESTPAVLNKEVLAVAPDGVLVANHTEAQLAVYTPVTEDVTGRQDVHTTSSVNQRAKALHSSTKESGNYLALNTLQFNFNQFDNLETEDFTTVMHYADRLIFDENLKVSVAGFADNTGDRDYNEKLSLMRALHVQHYLVDLGVKEEQIVVSAYGVESPVADNATKEGRALNRRVELALITE